VSASWETGFVAVSAAIGEPPDLTLAALGDRAEYAVEVLRGLESPSREGRARAVARVLSELALELEAARLV
jgi:hypothetical protein